MKTAYELRYLPVFYDDLVEKTDYIRHQLLNPKAADDLIDEVDRAIRERLSNPDSYEPYESVNDRKYKYYRIYVKNFVVFYVVIPGDRPIMEVRRILYKGQDRARIFIN